MNKKVAIIGAGLSGLTTAFYLKKMGVDITIFEKSDRVGGVIHSTNKNGFLYESGPNSGVLSHPETVELIDDLNGACQLEVASDASKKRWIWKGLKWHALPSDPIGGITTPLFSFKDKFRILGEPFRPKGTNPEENLKDFVLRRLGKSFLDYAVDPFILGIYAGDPSWLIPKYALPKLYNLEQKYGSFIGGSIKKRKEVKTDREKKATRQIFSIKGGLSQLIEALFQNIGKENIHLNCDSLNINIDDKKQYKVFYNEQSEKFDYVINNTGSHALPELFPFIEGNKMEKLTAMKYAKVIQCAIGFNQWNGKAIEAFGGLIPFKEQRKILGILFLSTIFNQRAPENGALFSVFLGGLRNGQLVDLPDEEVRKLVKLEVCAMMGIKEFNPTLFEIHRYQYAIPQYGPESKEKLQTISEVEKTYPGLILAGNMRDGIGMSDRIKQGKTIAQQIASLINETNN